MVLRLRTPKWPLVHNYHLSFTTKLGLPALQDFNRTDSNNRRASSISNSSNNNKSISSHSNNNHCNNSSISLYLSNCRRSFNNSNNCLTANHPSFYHHSRRMVA